MSVGGAFFQKPSTADQVFVWIARFVDSVISECGKGTVLKDRSGYYKLRVSGSHNFVVCLT